MPVETEVTPSTNESLISQEQLGDLLATVGNHESKAAALLMMQPGVFYSGYRMSGMLAAQQGKKSGSFPGHSTLNKYFVYTFEPIGLVAKAVNTRGSVEYGLTSKGRGVGKAFAGHLLEFSLRHPETSLRRVFGMTHSKDKSARPPILRYQILMDLVTSGNAMSQTEIAASTGLSYEEVSGHVDEMAEDGIITTKTISRPSVYRPIGTPYGITDTRYGRRELTEQVDRVLHEASEAEDGRITHGMIAREVHSDNEEKKLKRINERLHKLEKLGAVSLESRHVPRECIVWLSPEQAELASDACDLVEKLRTGSPEVINEGIEIGNSIIGSPRDLSELIEKSARNSPQANSVPFQEKASRIVEALSLLGPSSIEQITDYISDKRITRDSVKIAVKRMKQGGTVDLVRPRNGSIGGQWDLSPE